MPWFSSSGIRICTYLYTNEVWLGKMRRRGGAARSKSPVRGATAGDGGVPSPVPSEAPVVQAVVVQSGEIIRTGSSRAWFLLPALALCAAVLYVCHMSCTAFTRPSCSHHR
jgi:hypothetical protein